MHAQIVNRDELMRAMHDIGRTFGLSIRPYTATARAPFESYVSVMARTGILVSRHGPFLANSIFLPPGLGRPLPCDVLGKLNFLWMPMAGALL